MSEWGNLASPKVEVRVLYHINDIREFIPEKARVTFDLLLTTRLNITEIAKLQHRHISAISRDTVLIISRIETYGTNKCLKQFKKRLKARNLKDKRVCKRTQKAKRPGRGRKMFISKEKAIELLNKNKQ